MFDIDKIVETNVVKFGLWLLLAAIVIAVSAGGFYFHNFNSALSQDQAVWGSFGDFLGGTLNPLFSLFAILGLLLTIVQQKEALDLSREELGLSRREIEGSRKALEEQAKFMKLEIELNDINRLIDKLAERINKNFNENRLGKIREIGPNPLSMHFLVKQFIGGDLSPTQHAKKRLADRSSDVALTMGWIAGDLARLKAYIEAYEEALRSSNPAGKSPVIDKSRMFRDYFQNEYGDLVRLMNEMGAIHKMDVYRFYVKGHFLETPQLGT